MEKNSNIAKLEDSVLDQYNEQKISKKEMINILKWCEKRKEIISYLETILLCDEPEY